MIAILAPDRVRHYAETLTDDTLCGEPPPAAGWQPSDDVTCLYCLRDAD